MANKLLAQKLAIAGWVAFMIVPYFVLMNPDESEDSSLVKALSIVGLGAFITTFLFATSISFKQLQRNLFGGSGIVISLWLAYTVAVFPASLRPGFSLLYAIAIASVYFAFSSICRAKQPKMNFFYTYCSITIGVLLLGLVLYYGPPGEGDRRAIGAMRANTFAKCACVGAILCWFAETSGRSTQLKKLLRFAGIIFFCGLILLVRSRGTAIALIFFVILYYLLSSLSSKRRFVSQIIVFLLIGLFSLPATLALRDSSFAEKFLALGSEDRGLDSNFSGRTDYWKSGLEVLTERPWFGYGLRTRTSIRSSDLRTFNAHQGFLNIALDTGLIGLALFIIAVVGRLLASHNSEANSDFVHRASVIGLVLFLWLYEPNYLNLAQPMTLLLVSVLFFPVHRPSLASSIPHSSPGF